MSDDPPDVSALRLGALASELDQLSPPDQELVRALIARLRQDLPDSAPPAHRDVPFMEFDE